MARGINNRIARRRRENAFREQGGLCWYCKQVMVIRVLQPNERPAPDTCTLEHLRPRGHPDRLPGGYKVNVAACHACNQREGQKHAAELVAKGLRNPGTMGSRLQERVDARREGVLSGDRGRAEPPGPSTAHSSGADSVRPSSV